MRQMLAQRQEAAAATGTHAALAEQGVATSAVAQQLREAKVALAEAAAAREMVEAAWEEAEAGKAAAEAECRGLEAALVELAARMRRLVVVEAEPADADVATQTEAVAGASVSSQTDPEVAAAVQAASAMRTAGCEMVVGRQLHPAQAEAVERAERAAERLERLREQAEAAAVRYRVTDEGAEVLSLEATAQKAAQVPKVVTPTGGRQRRKAHVRRQAAAAGLDVLSWTVSGRRQQEEAEVASQAEMQRVLEQRLDTAHEQWLRRQRHSPAAEARVGEAEASRRFWQAARASGINLLDAPD